MTTKEGLILIFHCYYKLGITSQQPLKLLYRDKTSADVKWSSGSRGNIDSLFLILLQQKAFCYWHKEGKYKQQINFTNFSGYDQHKAISTPGFFFCLHHCLGAYITSSTDLTSWDEYFKEEATLEWQHKVCFSDRQAAIPQKAAESHSV